MSTYCHLQTTVPLDGPHLKQVDALANEIECFNSEKHDNIVAGYIRKIKYYLWIKLIWKTTYRIIPDFIEAQPASVHDSLYQLCAGRIFPIYS